MNTGKIQIQEAPSLETLVTLVPEKIKVGNHIEFPKSVFVIGYPIIKGDIKKRKAVFGTKSTFLVKSGEIITFEKNLLMLHTRDKKNNAELVFPMKHLSN